MIFKAHKNWAAVCISIRKSTTDTSAQHTVNRRTRAWQTALHDHICESQRPTSTSTASQEVTVNTRSSEHFLSEFSCKLTHDGRTNLSDSHRQTRVTSHHSFVLHLCGSAAQVNERSHRLWMGSREVNYRTPRWQTADKLTCKAAKEPALEMTAQKHWQTHGEAHLFVFMVTPGWHLSIFHEPTSARNKQINFPALDYTAKTIWAHGTHFSRTQFILKELWTPLFMVRGGAASEPANHSHSGQNNWRPIGRSVACCN